MKDITDSDKTEATEAAYDAVAQDYAERASGRSPEASRFAGRFEQRLEPGSRVVDLGCGPGEDLLRLADCGHRPIGLDRSAELLALAHHSPRVRADLKQLPFADGSADGIWAHASLLHVDSAALEGALVEWDRIVRPGGLVGFSTSLGGDSGWELVPAEPSRVPVMNDGLKRWFVHHDKDVVLRAIGRRGWEIIEATERPSHRIWLQVIARTAKDQR